MWPMVEPQLWSYESKSNSGNVSAKDWSFCNNAACLIWRDHPKNHREKKKLRTTGPKSPEKGIQKELHSGLGAALTFVKRRCDSAGNYCPKSAI